MANRKWIRGKVNPNNETKKNPTSFAANTSRVKDPIHAFGRDFDQNNQDPGLDRTPSVKDKIDQSKIGPPEVIYEVETLLGEDKKDFLEAIQYFDVGLPDAFSISQFLEAYRSDTKIKSVTSKEEMLDPKHPILILKCENNNSLGLVGPEGSFEEDRTEFEGIPRNYHALVNQLGGHQKGSMDDSGGVYGFGKEVTYGVSRQRMVFYYSRLFHPYNSRFGSHKGEVTRRFVGVNWLDTDVDMGTGPNFLRKSHFGVEENLSQFGEEYAEQESLTRSLYNEEADEMAELLGLRIRGGGDFGTTIVIVDFYDTDHECKEDATSLLSRLKQSQEWYYYPTLIDGRFKSTFKFSQGDQSPDPFSEPNSSGFAEAYKLVTKGEETEDFAFRRFNVPIPANPDRGFDEGREAAFLLGVKFSEVEVFEDPVDNEAKPRDNTIAWVRGAGLAVTHERQTHIGNPTKKFHGVLICGTQVERVFTDGDYDGEAQKMADRLISYSENVSHDEISDSSSLVDFQQWPDSRETIKRIKKKLRSELKKIVSDKGSDNPKGTAAPRFNLSFGTDGQKPRPRVISIINLNTSNPDHENWYQTSFTLRIPPSDSKDLLLEKDTDEAEYFTKWRVEVPLNFMEEDGGINSDRIPGSVVTIQEMKPDGTWTNLMKDGDCEYSPDSSDTSWVSGNFNSQWRTISIDIQTDFIDSYKASYGKVRAKPTTRLGREVDDS